MADEVRKAIQSDELKAIWAQQGAEFPDLTQQQFASFIDAEVKRWATVVKASNVKAD
jgi:tripartite-type tricarboxylate transporter receptor subunit TctC